MTDDLLPSVFTTFGRKPACLLIAFILSASGFSGVTPIAALEDVLEEEVALESDNSGSACVMVFGRVGEAFEYQANAKGAAGLAGFREGLDASGAPCRLPEGISFDRESLTLQGVPRRAGFHEFVLLATERGVTTEKVVLIDIQSPAFPAFGTTYASYFLGGVR